MSEDTKKILRKQLELLSERSKEETNGVSLAQMSDAMRVIAELLSENNG